MKLVMFPNGALSRYEEVPEGCIEVEYEKKPQYPTVLVDQTEAANGKHGKAVALVQKAAKATGSSMGKAMAIELAIEAQKESEHQLKDLFWRANKMDVRQRIKHTNHALAVLTA